jgi:hypothetical protein
VATSVILQVTLLAGWANEVRIGTAGRQQETSQTDWTEPRFRGQMELFGESCRSGSRCGQWWLPVR